jgi:hypothetical protein
LAAIAVSVGVHAGLFVALALAPAGATPSVPSGPVDLVVIVGEDDSATGREAPVVELPGYSPAPSPKDAKLIDDPPPTAPSPPEPDARTTAAPQPTPAPASSGAEQAEGGTSIFPAGGSGRSVVYVLDRSMSMGIHDGFRRARAELLARLAQLPPNTRFQVIAYNRIAEPLAVHASAGLLLADRDTIAEVTRIISALRAEGKTDHVNALRHGLDLRPDVLYFVTDADELSIEQVAAVTRLNGGRTLIHVVELSAHVDEGSDTVLHQLAMQNRGTYRRVAVTQWAYLKRS